MKDVDMNAVHAVELEILKAVDALCEKHGLRYTIYCGTLLGAVRHGGFIPWDDDVDLAMPLKDYRRFLKVAAELEPEYVVAHYGNTPDFYIPWIHVVARGTTFLDTTCAELDVPWGISLDIYPMIGAWRTERGVGYQRKLIRLARKFRQVALFRARKDKSFRKQLLYRVPFPVCRAISDFLFWLVMRDPDKAERCSTIDAAPFEAKYAREDWREIIRLPFEDAEFPAPAQYDKILRRMYGDYMQLPPVWARNAHIYDITIVDPNRDYQEYRQEILKR